jgi:hypothetical protein
MRASMWPRTFATAFIFAVGPATTALGADEADPPRHRVAIDVGIGSAVGTVGLTYDYSIFPGFRGEAGVGWGFSGTQLSLMPKVVLQGHQWALTSGFGAALAVGGPSVEAGHGPSPSTIPWLNFDALGGECPTSGGLTFSAALGLSMPLRAFHWDFAELGETVKAFSVFPQGRVSLGWRF